MDAEVSANDSPIRRPSVIVSPQLRNDTIPPRDSRKSKPYDDGTPRSRNDASDARSNSPTAVKRQRTSSRTTASRRIRLQSRNERVGRNISKVRRNERNISRNAKTNDPRRPRHRHETKKTTVRTTAVKTAWLRKSFGWGKFARSWLETETGRSRKIAPSWRPKQWTWAGPN